MPLLDVEGNPEELGRRAAMAKRANNIFIASLVSILFCCIGGIVASILANRAQKDVDAGNLDSAQTKITIAMVLMIISFVTGVLGIIARLAS